MSKEVYNQQNEINIGKELEKKQIIDSSIVFIMFSIVFCGVCFVGWDKYDLILLLVLLFLVTMFLFALSKYIVKKTLNGIIIKNYNEMLENISTIQNQKTSQKEHQLNYEVKIKSIQEILNNLQEYSINLSELTNETQTKTSQTLDYTNNEYDAVKTNIEKMFSIRHKIQTIAELILELSDFVQSISSTIGLVEDIAEQTNLLALNAAVEAARAGEHGKGFAVVASEIRKLADESKQATAKIISLINDIQQTANSTVLATEEGTKEIESGLELAHVISENIEQLINVMNNVSLNMKQILNSSKRINDDTKQSDGYIKEISQIIEEDKKILDRNNDIFDRIGETSTNLKNSVV